MTDIEGDLEYKLNIYTETYLIHTGREKICFRIDRVSKYTVQKI